MDILRSRASSVGEVSADWAMRDRSRSRGRLAMALAMRTVISSTALLRREDDCGLKQVRDYIRLSREGQSASIGTPALTRDAGASGTAGPGGWEGERRPGVAGVCPW